jgi:hypothetical protein
LVVACRGVHSAFGRLVTARCAFRCLRMHMVVRKFSSACLLLAKRSYFQCQVRDLESVFRRYSGRYSRRFLDEMSCRRRCLPSESRVVLHNVLRDGTPPVCIKCYRCGDRRLVWGSKWRLSSCCSTSLGCHDTDSSDDDISSSCDDFRA